MNEKYPIAFTLSGLPLENTPCLIVWGHGWAMDKDAFKPFAVALATRATHIRVDFPGFGDSPLPPPNWGTADYADALAELVGSYRSIKKIIYVGHSFGGRVGIQMAARHREVVDGLFFVAGAGLPRKRSLYQTLKMRSKVYTFKALKHLAPFLGLNIDKLRAKFGSADYRNAGPLRQIFVRVVREDLSEQAQQIKCPTQLIYGSNDRETPPEIGERLQKLIPHATLAVLLGQDHYSVLAAGRHVIIKRLVDFIESLP